MPLKPELFAGEIFEPNSSDSRWYEMDNDYVSNLMRNMNDTLFKELGLNTDSATPQRDKDNNLILYEMDSDGKISDPLENGDTLDSLSFLEKIASGKIFAYPAGEKDPVQLQIDYDSQPPKMAYSKPMVENVYPKPKSVSFFTRIRSWFGNAKAKQEIAEYNHRLDRYNNSNNAKLSTENKRANLLKDEIKEHDNAVKQKDAEAEEAKRIAKEEALKSDISDYKSSVDKAMDLMQDIYGPDPVRKEDQVGCQYTSAQFKHLKSYDTKGIEIGGEQITDRQFMGVALAAVLTPECGGQVRAHEGLTREEEICLNSTFYTADLFAWGDRGRACIGQYFDKAQGPARDNAFKALQEYKNGNKEPLGKLIGKGLHMSAERMEHTELDKDAYVAPNAALAEVVDLLDKDPDLMKHAKEAGMSEDDLNIARADKYMGKLYRENEWAKGRIEEAERAKNGDPNARSLTEDEKKFCIETRLKKETLSQEIKLHTAERESSEEYVAGITETMMERTVLNSDIKNLYKEKEATNMSQEEFDKKKKAINLKEEVNAAKMKNAMVLAVGVPNVVKQLGKKVGTGDPDAMLNKMIDANLPNKNILNSFDGKALNDQLNMGVLFAKNSPYMPAPKIEEVPKMDAPAKTEPQAEANKEADKEVTKMDKETFKDRVKMFSGPVA